MPILAWDTVGDRQYETGLDRGVLYLSDGSAVPWNGLTSVIEEFDKTTSPVYYDGMKINELVTLGDFAATMKAFTYPDEFIEIEGIAQLRPGLFVGDQAPQTFGLSYRTLAGNDVDGDPSSYKIHLIYNLIAIPSSKTQVTMADVASPVEFEWKITAIPEDIPGVRPTAHIIIDSDTTDPWLMEELEEILYGSSNAIAALLPMKDFVSYIAEWYRVKITDNLDGTWTATSKRDGFIDFPFPTTDYSYFEITGVNVLYLDTDTFQITDTTDISQVPLILIVDNGDGTWIASTDDPSLIQIDDYGQFIIASANSVDIGTDAYQISDTPQDM